MTERDRPASKILWNWDRILLALALVVAIGVGLDQHWADDKIIVALTQDLQSTQNLLDTSQAEKAAVESVSLEAFLKQYNAHVAALNKAVAAYDEAAKVAAAGGSNIADQTQLRPSPEHEMNYTQPPTSSRTS
jgi:hypothetical protein